MEDFGRVAAVTEEGRERITYVERGLYRFARRDCAPCSGETSFEILNNKIFQVSKRVRIDSLLSLKNSTGCAWWNVHIGH